MLARHFRLMAVDMIMDLDVPLSDAIAELSKVERDVRDYLSDLRGTVNSYARVCEITTELFGAYSRTEELQHGRRMCIYHASCSPEAAAGLKEKWVTRVGALPTNRFTLRVNQES